MKSPCFLIVDFAEKITFGLGLNHGRTSVVKRVAAYHVNRKIRIQSANSFKLKDTNEKPPRQDKNRYNANVWSSALLSEARVTAVVRYAGSFGAGAKDDSNGLVKSQGSQDEQDD